MGAGSILRATSGQVDADWGNPVTLGKSFTGKDAAPVEERPSAHLQARILAEAIPHLIRYDEQTVVVKFGGSAMGDAELSKAFAQDIVYLKQSGINPIVVHGGGAQIAHIAQNVHLQHSW